MPNRSSAARRARVLAPALAAALAIVPATTLATAVAAGAAPAMYYVAMGDSLGAGTGATGANAYVQRIYQHELARTPGLQLQNFSCGGATTASVLNSHSCGASVTQEAEATAFLQAHPGQIAFLTIDIGGNDVDGCGTDSTCIGNGLAAINTNLPQILSGLKSAYPGIRVFGMNYYDPFLASWLTGPSGETAAQQSVPEADAFNTILTDRYADAGFATADVAAAFQTDDFSLTGSYNTLTLPQNVANICNWTHMCEGGDIHANDTGHGVLAGAFEPLIDAPTVPGAPTGIFASPGNGTATVRWTAPAADGGSALTGYAVTPYLGGSALATQVFNSAATTETVTGLTNGKTYAFRVAAQSVIGTGAMSVAGSATVGAPVAPTNASASPGSATATVRWTTPLLSNGSPITGYSIYAYKGGAFVKTLTVGVVTQATVAGLVNGTAYSFKITAKNGRGSSHPAATPPIVVGAPRAPGGVTATGSAGRATVHWATPANNGASITAYVVTPFTSGVAQTPRTFTATTTTRTVTGLLTGHAYTFRVAARNARGTGPQSAASNVVTPT